MRIAFFGSSLVSAYWNGAATYYRGLLRALAARGHEIAFFEPDAFERQQHRDMPDPPWARVVVYPATVEGVERAFEQARGADLIVKASGVGVFDDLLEAGVLAQASARSLVAFWDVDAPATLDSMASNPADPLRALIPRYDVVLTYGGGALVREAYLKLGAQACVPVYNALFPTHYVFHVGDGPGLVSGSPQAHHLEVRDSRRPCQVLRSPEAPRQHNDTAAEEAPHRRGIRE